MVRFHFRSSLRSALVLAAITLILAAAPASGLVIDFAQGSNKNPTPGVVIWLRSILQQSNSTYYEGTSTLQRVILTDLAPTSANQHRLTFRHQANKSTSHAYDFITSWDQAVQAGNTIGGPTMFVTVDACGEKIGPPSTLKALCNSLHSSGNTYNVDAPDAMGSVLGDNVATRVSAYEAILGNRTIRMYGSAPITSASLAFNGYVGSGDAYAEYTLTWVSASSSVAIEMAGHLASGIDPLGPGIGYGKGKGSANISGGPYHFKMENLDGASLGSQDNQIKGADILIPPPVCSVAPGNLWSCLGGSVSFLDVTTGGGGGYTYCWQKAPYSGACLSTASSFNIANAAAADSGWYRVIVTDANALSDTCYAYFGIWEHPECNLAPGFDTLCVGSSTTFSDNTSGGAGGFSYCWQKEPYTGPCLSTSSYLNIAGATAADSGWYRVVVTDANTCTDTAYAYLGLYESPVCTVTPASVSVCVGGKATFVDNTTEGTGQYAYCWQKEPYTGACLSTTDTLALANVQAADAGIYRVIVTEPCGCSDTCYATLTVWSLPSCVITGAPSVCAGNTTKWCAPSPPEGIDYTYAWTGPGGFTSSDSCVYVGTAGSYSLKITDSHGCECSSVKNLVVYTLPTCGITRTGGERDTICPCFDPNDPAANNQYCGPAGANSYSWSVTGGASIVGSAISQCVIIRPIAHCDTTFTLSLTLTDAHGCSNTCEKTVFVVDKTPPVIVYCPPDTVLECSDNLDDAFNPLGAAAPPGARSVNISSVWQPVALDECGGVGADYADTGGRPTNWSRRVDSWGNCNQDTTVLRTWTLTDDCGNKATCQQVIAIQDTVPPMLTCSPNDTVPCGTEVVFTPPPSVADNCDPLRLLDVTEVSTDVVPGPNTGDSTYTRCWVASDSCGNVSALCCQSIIVEACPDKFCTFSTGGWGNDCPPDKEGDLSSTQPGCILQNYFSQAFPGGSVGIGDPAGIGGGPSNLYAAVWTDADAVQAFLPARGTSGMLTQDALNPLSTSAGVLAGHILALRLNVEFSCAGVFKDLGIAPIISCYRQFILPASFGKFAGLTVEQFLAVADEVVGGNKSALNPFGATLSDLNTTAANLNLLFDGCVGSVTATSAGMASDEKPVASDDGVTVLVPQRFFVRQSYPNPFNPSATVVFGLPKDGRVTVEICDVAGRNVATLVDAVMPAGYHSTVWFGKDASGDPVASGVYFCRVSFAGQFDIQKLILLR